MDGWMNGWMDGWMDESADDNKEEILGPNFFSIFYLCTFK